jgi:hypothetical protein
VAVVSEPVFVPISVAATGTLVAALATGKIRVVSLFLVNATAQTVQFQSGDGTALTGVMTIGTSVLVLPFNNRGWFESKAADGLKIALGATNQCSGGLSYVQVDN